MTTTETDPNTVPDPKPAEWVAAFPDLQARFPGTKDTVLFCIHALTTAGEVELDEVKAKAAEHGIRITAASLASARRLLRPSEQPARPKAAVRRQAGQRRRQAGGGAHVGAEVLVREFLESVEQRGNAEVERLRACIQQAIRLLQVALER